MERIILIETSTALCSVALAEDGAIVAYRESSAPKAHASLTAVFIQEMLEERGLALADCDAVCVSMGPGSYTGLRVGVSTAKGLCFGSGKPLLAVGTLDTLVAQALASDCRSAMPEQEQTHGQVGNDGMGVARGDGAFAEGDPNVIADLINVNVIADLINVNVIADLIGNLKYIIPMVDARRMEVYTAVFEKAAEGDAPYRQITETAPAIIDENSFAEYLEQGPCLFIGDGAGKCADVIKHPNAHFCQCHPKASSMLSPALAAYRAGDFKDVAYFEPFYLKEFVATVSKKKMW